MKRKVITGTLIIVGMFFTIAAMHHKNLFQAQASKGDSKAVDNEHLEHDGHDSCTEKDDCSSSGHDHEAVQEADHDHEHGHAAKVKLAPSVLKEFDIEIANAQNGIITLGTTLPAEISLNADTVVHIVPRLSGIVRSVSKGLGDKVKAGDVLAVMNSRELADLKAAYLGAVEKLALAQTMYDREKNLWEKNITPEQEYLDARKYLADAQIEMRSADQKLHALGFSQAYLKDLANHPVESFTIFEIVAPITGTIIDKHITQGEMLKDDSQLFTLADLSNVWVSVNVHQKDLARIRCGQTAVVKTDHNQARGVVNYVSPVLDEKTRTAQARIVLPNEQGIWRPGTFASAAVTTDQIACEIVVPSEALVKIENKVCVFVPEEDGFVLREVKPGIVTDSQAQIKAGLQQGEQYVAKGAFTLKSELTKSTEDPCGGH